MKYAHLDKKDRKKQSASADTEWYKSQIHHSRESGTSEAPSECGGALGLETHRSTGPGRNPKARNGKLEPLPRWQCSWVLETRSYKSLGPDPSIDF